MTGDSTGAAKILVVDDVPMNVKLLADLLAAKHYRTCSATSGAEALAVLERERPDLVLLDVMMPGMSGYDVCRHIRADPAQAMLPVVLVTALDPAEERATFGGEGTVPTRRTQAEVERETDRYFG